MDEDVMKLIMVTLVDSTIYFTMHINMYKLQCCKFILQFSWYSTV